MVRSYEASVVGYVVDWFSVGSDKRFKDHVSEIDFVGVFSVVEIFVIEVF